MGKEIVLSAGVRGFSDEIYNTLASVPEGHLLFVGPVACARHQLAVARPYQASGRVSYLFTRPEDEAKDLQETVLAAARDIAREQPPRSLILLMCCSAAVLATDYDALAGEIERETSIPTQVMEVNRLHLHEKRGKPVMKVSTQTLVYRLLRERSGADRFGVNLIGSCEKPAESNDLPGLLAAEGVPVRYLAGCGSFEEFQEMGDSALNISMHPGGDSAAADMEKRLGIPWLPLHSSYLVSELCGQYEAIYSFLGIRADLEPLRKRGEDRMEALCGKLRGLDVSINGMTMEKPYSLARVLLDHGVAVKRIWFSRFTGKEHECEDWLRENVPSLEIRECRPEDGKQQAAPPPARSVQPPEPGFLAGFGRFFSELDQMEAQALGEGIL